MSLTLRRLAMGLATVTGLRQRGFFIPYRYAAGVDAAVGYPALERVFAAAAPAALSLLDDIDGHAEALLAIGRLPPPAPRWDQDWFPRLDAAAAYAMVCRLAPRRVVEVGSGHSTRFIARALADRAISAEVVAVDPAPRAALAGLAVRHVAATIQTAPRALFAGLGPGDVLFVDSSHIAMPGTDVDILLNDVLPRLPAGVVVHIHDIFLPDPYPAAWSARGYNEQQAVAPLLAGQAWEVLFASRWVATRCAERLARSVVARLPLVPGAFETSLWLRKRSGPLPTAP